MQKGFVQTVTIFLFVLISLVGIIYFYPSKKSNSNDVSNSDLPIIVNSKDYSSPLGFNLKYSKNFLIKEDSEEEFNKRGNGNFRKNFEGYIRYEPGDFLGAVVVLDKEDNFDINPFTVWIFYNPSDLSIDDWYKKYWYYPFVWGDFTQRGKIELAPKDEATVSGQIGKSEVIDYQPGKPRFIYLSQNRKMYLFRIIGSEGDSILTSFQFLAGKQDKVEGKDSLGCRVGGCSGQLCVDANYKGVSTCEHFPIYSCYQKAQCKRQENGKCGWSETEEFNKCLKDYSK